MSLITPRQLLEHASVENYAVPAFNVNNMEQIQAADETDSPVILQTSAGARKYAGSKFLRHLIEAAMETWPHIPVVVHQDHGASPAVCLRSIQLGHDGRIAWRGYEDSNDLRIQQKCHK